MKVEGIKNGSIIWIGSYGEIQKNTSKSFFNSFLDVFTSEDGINFGSKIWLWYYLDG